MSFLESLRLCSKSHLDSRLYSKSDYGQTGYFKHFGLSISPSIKWWLVWGLNKMRHNILFLGVKHKEYAVKVWAPGPQVAAGWCHHGSRTEEMRWMGGPKWPHLGWEMLWGACSLDGDTADAQAGRRVWEGKPVPEQMALGNLLKRAIASASPLVLQMQL